MIDGHMETARPGTLYLVATPIGNLRDITLRALDILRSVDEIFCEDTRTSRRLLERYGIQKPLFSYHEHNESARVDGLVQRLQEGKSLALISDAGTPTISDPGYRIVHRCRRLMLPVVPIPGPTALIGALSASGLPTNGFLFVGFLPPKSSARRRFFEQYVDFPYTLIFYESCHRLEKFLADGREVFSGARTIGLAKELTKCHETFLMGSIESVLERLQGVAIRGEFVVLVAPDGFLWSEKVGGLSC